MAFSAGRLVVQTNPSSNEVRMGLRKWLPNTWNTNIYLRTKPACRTRNSFEQFQALDRQSARIMHELIRHAEFTSHHWREQVWQRTFKYFAVMLKKNCIMTHNICQHLTTAPWYLAARLPTDDGQTADVIWTIIALCTQKNASRGRCFEQHRERSHILWLLVIHLCTNE